MMPATTPAQQQQQCTRGPANNLHAAAYHGSTKLTTALLSRGSINIDQGDPDGITPLMYAAQDGHSRVVRLLLGRGASVSRTRAEGAVTALHLAVQNGHLAITIDLIKARADLEARNADGDTPILLAASCGYSEVLSVLIEAGADVDSRGEGGATALYLAASQGLFDIIRELLRANANPLLAWTMSGLTLVPLDVAAGGGHSKVVRHLIQQRGIEGCAGASGGVIALCAAAEGRHLETMALLMDAGVVDTGEALVTAAKLGGEGAVKLLLQQQRKLAGSPPTGLAEYVNFRDRNGSTALFASVEEVIDENSGEPRLVSPRVVRLLIDAGADPSPYLVVRNDVGEGRFGGTRCNTPACVSRRRNGTGERTQKSSATGGRPSAACWCG